MQENKTLSRAEWLDKIFGTPVFAVLLAIFCNCLLYTSDAADE